MALISRDEAATLERCMAVGGVAVFPADTVYGLACDPEAKEAVDRIYAMKGRPPVKPSAVLVFQLELALAALPELGTRTRMAVETLLPGALTLLLPNPARRFPLACGPDPATVGLRVPALPPALEALGGVRWPILQTSANASGGADARRLEDVPAPIREAADLLLDGGELPGTPSTVVDLRRFEVDGGWSVVREGAVSAVVVGDALQGVL
ncbi:L-threonylcarbamoyladenylate synthase [Conexibacter sp. SYSU D00693]|uniref:L-threonylcarbamoyladenylate synthase n=1 Tax=Conexibacter sp. SYSU D00693 TaxID=2812560 RepID=UPI00196AFF54|nr:Sua5/YciO/YrdC/YwlC family protein [Conexibacter sp. SYSU D00693]